MYIHMYVYIHIYICIYMYIYRYLILCIYTYVCVHRYVLWPNESRTEFVVTDPNIENILNQLS
jgi:hypothetical protein